MAHIVIGGMEAGDASNENVNKTPEDTETSRGIMVNPPIDNDDIKSEEVILLDISSNKEWIAYVTYRKAKYTDSNYFMEGKKKCTYITRRKFIEIKSEQTPAPNIIAATKPFDEHVSLNITQIVKDGGKTHCKFLSISPDGRYIVLSFYERTKKGENGEYWEPNNPDCLIFVVDDDGKFSLYDRLKCDGRAVFLDQKNYLLALINTKVVEIYTEFPKITSASYLFDLAPFNSRDNQQHEEFQNDDLFIQNASWVDIEKIEKNQDMKRIMLLTRHIRHGILTTHFVGGIARVWSIEEDGVRFTSFPALGQNIMAFSKNYKYTAAYVNLTKSINIYNVKSGLLVYSLKSQKDSKRFEISHIRFCYDGRYIAMSGLDDNDVVFEVWYVEAEKSIYRTATKRIITASYLPQSKIVQPFIMRGVNSKKEKCLMGVYTSHNNGNNTTNFLELDIDKIDPEIKIQWAEDTNPFIGDNYEISNNLNDFSNLKCGYFDINGKRYLIRFGKHTVQLWCLSERECSPKKLISANDNLLYIRAYKGPDYGVDYSFRENWKIHDFNSIKFIGGISSGRMLVNITENENNSGNTNGNKLPSTYHTEELFLPLDESPFFTTSKTSISNSDLFVTADKQPIDNNRSRRFDYHKFESACQAFHFLTDHNTEPLKNKGNYDTMLLKTELLIKSAVGNIDVESNFFSTIAGSRTLAMLASFKSGREIIKLIVFKTIPISIFSYARTAPKVRIDEDEKYWNDVKKSLLKRFHNKFRYGDNSTQQDAQSEYYRQSQYGIQSEQQGTLGAPDKTSYRSSKQKPSLSEHCSHQSIAGNENVLTVLIEELNYDLYKLLFNRILSDSKKLGPGCLSALTDALLFLQEEGNSDLLFSSSHKLSFLEIEKSKLGVLQSELDQVIKVKTLQKEYISSLRNLESHAMMEQIKKYSGLRLRIYRLKVRLRSDRFNSITKSMHLGWRRSVVYLWKKLFKESRKDPKESSKVCVVPLPHFNTYSNLPEDRPKNSTDDVQTYKDCSAFVQVAMDQHSNNIFQQGDTVLEVMLQYKWKQFARWRFAWICAIHILYYVSYSTGVLFSQELYYHDPEEEFVIKAPGQIVSVTLMSLAVFILVLQEARQFWKTHSRLEYFFSGYNWIDLAAFVFPIFTLIQLKYGWNYFNEVCSISTLILWTHGILRLRVISYFGITLETIIQLCKNVTSVLFIMLLVILAFTQAYIVLLRLAPDEYFQENYSGTYNAIDNSTSGETNFADVSSDNGFHNWFKAFSQVWFFVYGVWDPLNDGDAGDSKFLMCLSIFFSLITVLIFFNLVIALMASTVEEVKKRGKKVWVSHFAAVVSEIEYLWCLRGAKHSRKNNPTYIYYIATEDSVLKHEEGLQKETAELVKKIKNIVDTTTHP